MSAIGLRQGPVPRVRNMFVRALAFPLYAANVLICRTLKYEAVNEPKSQALFAVWHGLSFPLFYWGRHRKFCLLPIGNWRGDVIAYLAGKYGYRTVRLAEKGSPLERSASLKELWDAVGSGCEVALAVDGPPPPLKNRKAKPGILYLSQKTGVPVVPAKIIMERKFTCFWRWDRYEIPLPYSKVRMVFGEPIPPGADNGIERLESFLRD